MNIDSFENNKIINSFINKTNKVLSKNMESTVKTLKVALNCLKKIDQLNFHKVISNIINYNDYKADKEKLSKDKTKSNFDLKTENNNISKKISELNSEKKELTTLKKDLTKLIKRYKKTKDIKSFNKFQQKRNDLMKYITKSKNISQKTIYYKTDSDFPSRIDPIISNLESQIKKLKTYKNKFTELKNINNKIE